MTTRFLSSPTTQKKDLLLILSLIFIFYNVIVLLASPSVGVEGFEAHITSYAQNKLLHPLVYEEATPEYTNRPGEFLLYDLISFIFAGDVLQVAEIISAFAYILTGISIFLILRRFNQGAALLSLFTFSISFDLVATAAQASSVNLAYASGLIGILVFFLDNVLNNKLRIILSVLAFSLSIFFRTDSVLMFPFIMVLMLSKRESVTLVFCLLLVSFVLAMVLYKTMGISLLDVLINGSGKRPWIDLNNNILLNFLFPYKFPLLLLSVIGLYRYKDKGLVSAKYFIPTLTAISILVIYALAYKGMLETPRFLSFPEIIWAMVLAYNFSIWPNQAFTKQFIVIAFTAFTVIGFYFRYELLFPEAQRFVGFPVATPAYTLRTKFLLEKADKIVFSEIDKCSSTNVLDNQVNIIVTAWGEFRRQKRLIIQNGGYQIPYEGNRANIRMIDSFSYRSKIINLFFVESGIEYKDPKEFYSKVDELNLKQISLFITENKLIADTLPTSLGRGVFTVLNNGKNHIYLSTCEIDQRG